MSIDRRQALASLRALLKSHLPEELRAKLRPPHDDRSAKVITGSEITEPIFDQRWATLPSPASRAVLHDVESAKYAAAFSRNIENYIGTVKIPVGVAGPVRINGTHAHGDYYVPLATTE